MDMKEIQKKKDADLVKEIATKRTELRKARFAMQGASAQDVKKLRELRRDIARIMTELRQRELRTNEQAS